MGSQVTDASAASRPWIETPCIYSAALSKAAGCNVYLKLECLQPSGSFKSRGIGNLMVRALERAGGSSKVGNKADGKVDGNAGKDGVHFYCSSGGNAGLACATAARDLGAPATIVVPFTTSQYMVAKLRAIGAEVVQTGATWAEADEHLRQTYMQGGKSDGMLPTPIYVPPFDHPDIWAGAATIVAELPRQLPAGVRPDALVCSVGGGGLLCGLMEGVESVYGGGERSEDGKDSDRQPPQVVAVETDGADSLAASVRAGGLVRLPGITSIATSLGATQVAAQAFAWSQKQSPQSPQSPRMASVVVCDVDAVDAMVRFLDDTRLLVEPACGAALAPLYTAVSSGDGDGDDGHKTTSMLRARIGAGLSDAAWAARTVVVIVCGGSNINTDMLAGYRQRFGV